MALCVTRFEKYEPKFEEEIKGQLTKHQVLGPLIREYGIEIFFAGCVIPTEYNSSAQLDAAYTRVCALRKKLMEFIIDSRAEQHLLDLGVMADKKIEVRELIDQLVGSFKSLANAKDLRTSDFETTRLRHLANMKRLAGFGETYLRLNELVDKYEALISAAKQLYARADIPQPQRDSLIVPLALN